MNIATAITPLHENSNSVTEDMRKFPKRVDFQVNEVSNSDPVPDFLNAIRLIERAHQSLLRVLSDEFEHAGIFGITPVQGLVIFDIGIRVMSLGEMKSRCDLRGSSVGHDLKSLVELGYIVSERCDINRRSVRVRLTEKGLDVHFIIASLLYGYAEEVGSSDRFGARGMKDMNDDLRVLVRYTDRERGERPSPL